MACTSGSMPIPPANRTLSRRLKRWRRNFSPWRARCSMAAPISWPMRFSRWKALIGSRRPRVWDGSRRPNLWFRLRRPDFATRHPQIRHMAEQLDLALNGRPESPGHGLRGDVFRADGVDDPVDFETCEGPIDRGACRLDRVAPA